MDPAYRKLLDKTAGNPPQESIPLLILRQAVAQLRRAWSEKYGSSPVGAVRDMTVPGPAGPIPIRIYTPEGTGPFPVVAYFHGGGFSICDLETHDEPCRQLCRNAGCMVVATDYRLAPEHPFPAGIDDCLAVVRWIGDHGRELGADDSRIAVAGDSAGGNLAAVTALRVRDEGGPALVGQALIYPMTDHYRRIKPSLDELGMGCGLTATMIAHSWDSYLTDPRQGDHPWASPLQASSLAGLPAAFVVTAEYDPLRDEGEMYAQRLAASGVETTLTRYLGVIHGFDLHLPLHPSSVRLQQQAAAWLRRRFEPGGA